jgi:hypothetical protein
VSRVGREIRDCGKILSFFLKRKNMPGLLFNFAKTELGFWELGVPKVNSENTVRTRQSQNIRIKILYFSILLKQ